MPAGPEPGDGRRLALILATTSYTESLRELRAPARDAADLGAVLGDPGIGGFAVTSVLDRTAPEIKLAVEDFLSDRDPADLLLVYLSCHGLVDQRRRLYFAGTDTVKARLAATGVEAQWLLDQLEDCRARRQVLILDCCFSGAFARGAKGEQDLDLGERFTGHGRGRVVLTASRGTEYSFEGTPVPGAAMPGSVFTDGLVTGLRTGAADTDHDGLISVDDAYRYAFDHVRATAAQQTPQRWLYGAEGEIVLARAAGGSLAGPLPPAIPAARHSAVRRKPGAGRGWPLPVNPYALAAAVLIVVAVAVALIVRAHGSNSSSSRSPTAGHSVLMLTATAPWRLYVEDRLGAGDNGCKYAVADHATHKVLLTVDTNGHRSYQMHASGTFDVARNDTMCTAVVHTGAGTESLPFAPNGYEGDTDSFAAPAAVQVRVVKGSECRLDLYDVNGGQPLDAETAGAGDTINLETQGSARVYLADVKCNLAVSAG